MFQGNWPCSQCNATITQLPFEPKSDKGLTCRDCYFKQKDGQANTSAPADAISSAPDEQEVPDDLEFGAADEQTDVPDFAPDMTVPAAKPSFSGDWQCGTCGGAITSLPFEPRSTANLKCLDCFKASKA